MRRINAFGTRGLARSVRDEACACTTWRMACRAAINLAKCRVSRRARVGSIIEARRHVRARGRRVGYAAWIARRTSAARIVRGSARRRRGDDAAKRRRRKRRHHFLGTRAYEKHSRNVSIVLGETVVGEHGRP